MILSINWECRHGMCNAWATTYDAAIPHHSCRYAGGLTIPLVRADRSEEVRLVEREDYVGDELVQVRRDTGRPVMAVERRRDDGIDTSVYAPTARTDQEAPGG